MASFALLRGGSGCCNTSISNVGRFHALLLASVELLLPTTPTITVQNLEVLHGLRLHVHVHYYATAHAYSNDSMAVILSLLVSQFY